MENRYRTPPQAVEVKVDLDNDLLGNAAWVIMPDGNLKNYDSSDDAVIRWNRIEEFELVIKFNKDSDEHFEVVYFPRTGLTDNQCIAVEKIEVEIKKVKTFENFGWGLKK